MCLAWREIDQFFWHGQWDLKLCSCVFVFQSVENSVCILRNLSYHVHKEVPGAEKFHLQSTNHASKPAAHHKKKDDLDCFSGRSTKGHTWSSSNQIRHQLCSTVMCDNQQTIMISDVMLYCCVSLSILSVCVRVLCLCLCVFAAVVCRGVVPSV